MPPRLNLWCFTIVPPPQPPRRPRSTPPSPARSRRLPPSRIARASADAPTRPCSWTPRVDPSEIVAGIPSAVFACRHHRHRPPLQRRHPLVCQFRRPRFT
uniref:Uncharacterized protein n=1 Tax=Arundo donax TaxID=35708 RepID=A0A0A8YGY2_ARUDO